MTNPAAALLLSVTSVVSLMPVRAGLVTHTGDAGAGSLRGEIEAAGPGDRITFAPGLSGATIVLASGQLVIGRDLTVDGSGLAMPVTVDGNGILTRERVVRVDAPAAVVIDGLVLTGGWTPDAPDDDPHGAGPGGGIHNAGVLTIRNCKVHNNRTGDGRDDFVYGGDGGGGGGIHNEGQMVVENCIISGNETGMGGNGLGGYNDYEDDWKDNRAFGGGEYYGDRELVEIVGRGGLGGRGGGISNTGDLVIGDSTVTGNATGMGGDGVDNPFEDGDGGHGRTKSGGSGGPGGEGGGLFNTGSLRVENVTISGNTTGGGGQGANGTPGVGGLGGAFLQSGGQGVVENATISGNTTSDGEKFGGSGAGVFLGSGSFSLRNVTLAENRTGYGGFRGGSGAGVFQYQGDLVIESSTISANVTGEGLSYPGGVGGLYTQDGKLRVANSIIAGNRAGLGNQDYERANTRVDWIGGNMASGDPMLAPLGYHGGPTQTMPPLSGSPVIDEAVPGADTPATDQRGLPRIVGGGLDIGAVETGSAAGYATWAAGRIPAGGDAAFAGDADGDGVRNGVEYACGADGSPAIARLDGRTDLLFGYRSRAQVDVIVKVMKSIDCRNYSEILRIEAGEVTKAEGLTLVALPSGLMVREEGPTAQGAYYRTEAALVEGAD